MKGITKVISNTLILALLLSLLPLNVHAQEDTATIEVEAPAKDGEPAPTKKIDFVDQDLTGKDNYIALLSYRYGSRTGIDRNNCVVIQVDRDNIVKKVVNGATEEGMPSWNESSDIEILQGGYVLFASDNSYANQGFKKFLAENFRVGDKVTLRYNGEPTAIDDILEKIKKPVPKISLENNRMYTVKEDYTTVNGSILDYKKDGDYILKIDDKDVQISEDGTFNHDVYLDVGTNYIDIVLSVGDEIVEESLVVYKKADKDMNKEVVLWIAQWPNSRNIKTKEDVHRVVREAKDAGVTAICMDVKGYEGFVSYKKNTLSRAPHISEMQSENRTGANPDIDLLEEFVESAHKLDLKVFTSFDVFGEGSMYETAVLDEHPEWEERVQRPEDGGKIVPIRQSKQSNKVVAFVNPANDEVQEYELKLIEEVLMNYDVDGITLDRCRYDNIYADFSDETREKFEAYLKSKGKTLDKWPDDVFKIQDGKKIEGKHYLDWLTFRSGIIKEFTSKVRSLVNEYSNEKGKDILLSTYVGSWYESLYGNGVNWASPNFKYDSRLKLPEDRIYTEEYIQTGYINNLDFIMIGTYYDNVEDVNEKITLGNIITQDEIPIYASIELARVAEPAVQREVIQTAINNSAGTMIFDLCTTNWPVLKAAINDVEYVKDFQLGISNPKDNNSFIEATDRDINRIDGDIIVYTNQRGASTGTNQWGVEVIVDDTGKVIGLKNKQAAIDWNWGNPEQNNSDIPEGGFVISTVDKSGERENRQLIAKTYDIGDEVRAAILSGYTQYDGIKVQDSKISIKGNVEVLGIGKPKVKVNDEVVPIDDNGDFAAVVDLFVGVNEVSILVNVDEKKTNEKTIQIVREKSDLPEEPVEPADPIEPPSEPEEPVETEWVVVDDITIKGTGHIQGLSIDKDNDGVYKDKVFTLGTIGESRRLEGFTLDIEGSGVPSDMMLVYRAHVQTYGDMPSPKDVVTNHIWRDNMGNPWNKGGTYLGTKAERKRVEGIELRLIDKKTKKEYEGYKIQYQVHMQGYGWGIDDLENDFRDNGKIDDSFDKWAANGEFAGTRGQGRRIEAIRIRILREQPVK